jgi:hypothetical protein
MAQSKIGHYQNLEDAIRQLIKAHLDVKLGIATAAERHEADQHDRREALGAKQKLEKSMPSHGTRL